MATPHLRVVHLRPDGTEETANQDEEAPRLVLTNASLGRPPAPRPPPRSSAAPKDAKHASDTPPPPSTSPEPSVAPPKQATPEPKPADVAIDGEDDEHIVPVDEDNEHLVGNDQR